MESRAVGQPQCVRPQKTTEMDADVVTRILDHAFKLWFEPELKRRAAEGRIQDGFAVWAVQVVLNLDADPEVRINQEVKGAFIAKAGKKAHLGETLSLKDIAEMQSMQLTEEDPNAGHLTAVIHNRRWHVFFDFRYNAARIESQLKAADEFMAAAADAAERGHAIAAVDNLFDAVQLMAKSFLLITPERGVVESKTHGFIETRFNRQAKLGNVTAESARLLNRLAQLRPKTRYALKPVQVPRSELQNMLASAQAMRAEMEEHRPRRAKAKTRHAV
jgi:hypothetical protein